MMEESSNPWATSGFGDQAIRPPAGLSRWKREVEYKAQQPRHKRGAALIVALWVLIILSLLIGSFAFDMHVEAAVTSYYRKRFKAQYLSRAGVEWAKVLLARSGDIDEDEEILDGEDESLVISAINLSKGVGVRGLERELGPGKFKVDVVPEGGRRNVNTLTDDDWEEVLDQANVPEDRWDELVDCFRDWTDGNDEHRLNGAESDDGFYTEREYECKNAALDTVDELLLIKGFDEGIVYGASAEDEDDEPLLGIARLLTVWGDGKVNVNSAKPEVLMTMPEMDEFAVEDIVRGRLGIDEAEGTRDDGFESVDEAASIAGLPGDVKGRLSTSVGSYVRVVSIGEVQGVRSGIWCVLHLEGQKVTPVFWREEDMP